MGLKQLTVKLHLQIMRFVADLRGVSTVEYALIVVAIIGIVGAGAIVLGGAFGELFDDLEAEMTAGVGNVLTAASTAAT